MFYGTETQVPCPDRDSVKRDIAITGKFNLRALNGSAVSMPLLPFNCSLFYGPKIIRNEKKDDTQCVNSMKLVIPLHSSYWSIHTKDESKRGTAFAFIFGVN